MVTKRQRLARKQYLESHGDSVQTIDRDVHKTKTDRDSKKRKRKSDESKNAGGDVKASKKPNSKSLRKHPLRVPGSKPGEGCFICGAGDHIAKACPTKDRWDSKKICLLCRERGHTMKHCYNNQQNHDTKYCYNCGQTGHRLSECPEPIQNGGTAFAECFLCKERGHLSKNCPTNTHGIYPKGGSCKICGGLTHLAKDCPEKNTKRLASGRGQTKLQISREPATAAKPGEQGKRIVFPSGDDLEDDFILNDGNTWTDGDGHLIGDELSTKVETLPLKLTDVGKQPKVREGNKKHNMTNSNKSTTKVVDFC